MVEEIIPIERDVCVCFFCVPPAVMKFMGDLPLKGQSELDVVYALLKVIFFAVLACIKPCGADDGRVPGSDGVLFFS